MVVVLLAKIVLLGVRVNREIIIGSGSIVRKDIKQSGIYAGNPIKKIK